jgi:DNA transformation protein and related proteins
MDAEGLKELFEPFGPVAVKRMFSGHGIYADGWCFALSLRGDIYLRTDVESAAALAAAGSTQFVYQRGTKAITTNLWRLVASAYDDPDEIRQWSRLALAAARRIGEAKAAKAMARKAKAAKGSKPAKSTKSAKPAKAVKPARKKA